MNRKIKYLLALTLLLFVPVMLMADGFTVVLDAGHGGKDPGAVGSKRTNREKDINLAVVKEIGRLISANYPGVKVVYTRTTDVFLELGRRAEIANNNNADLFVSIHVNALPKGQQTSGVQSYTLTLKTAKENLAVEKRENDVILLESSGAQKKYGYNRKSPEDDIMWELMQDSNMKNSVQFAKMAQNQMVFTGGRRNRGIKQANLAVLRLTKMPSALLEIGYISTPSEEAYLLSESGQKTIAKCIYNAIIEYKKSK